MKCTVCGATDKPVYRTAPKGEGIAPMWRCEECLKNPPDPELKEIVDILSGQAGKE